MLNALAITRSIRTAALVAILAALLMSLPPAVFAQASTDATLSALTVSPEDIIGFASDRTSYDVGVDSTVTQVTITATPNNPGARISYSDGDDDEDVNGHQVNLSTGRNEITITVTAADDNTTGEYTVSTNRGSTSEERWKASDDIDSLIDADNTNPKGIWGNKSYIWVADGSDNKIYAYNRSNKLRNPAQDFDMLANEGSEDIHGIWSDGETMWVSNSYHNRLNAYDMVTKQRSNSKELVLLGGNGDARGIWSEGETMWVADSGDDRLYAYDLASGASIGTKEFDIDTDVRGDIDPGGVWSDGVTIWIADRQRTGPDDQDRAQGRRVLAFRLAEKDRSSGRDIELESSGNHRAWGLWSDGETMWVGDGDDHKVYSYNMAKSDDDRIISISLDRTPVAHFDRGVRSYMVGVSESSAEVTIAASMVHPEASFHVTPSDSNPNRQGHQVSLDYGANGVTVQGRAESGVDENRSRYRLSINRASSGLFEWKADSDISGIGHRFGGTVSGITGYGDTTWIAITDGDTLFAIDADGNHDSSKDIPLHADNAKPLDLWTNGTTMWVANDGPTSDALFAYDVSSGVRQPDKELVSVNIHPTQGNLTKSSFWSNDEIMWVSDSGDDKAFAYLLSDGSRQQSRDIDFVDENITSNAIWSDGGTLWVADGYIAQLFAYRLSDGEPIPDLRGTSISHASPVGASTTTDIWGRDKTLYIADNTNNHVFAYNIPAPAPTGLSASADDARSSLTWTNPQRRDIDYYQYRVSKDRRLTWDPDWTTIPRSDRNTRAYLARNLTNNVEHQVEVRVVEDGDPGVSGFLTVTPQGPPGAPPSAPRMFEGSRYDRNPYVSWWALLLVDDSAPTTNYNVRYRILGTRTWSIDQTPHLETDSSYHGHTITGLAVGEGYEFQVAAVNAHGVGPYSVSTMVVPHPDVSVPVDAESPGGNLDLGRLGVHWTDEINGDMINQDSVGSNLLHGNSCYGPVGFKVSWDRAGSADEFQFHIDTNGGAGEVSYEVRRDGFVGNDGYRSMYGSVRMFGPGSVTIYARARHGEDTYSKWTNPAGLYCTEDPLPFTEELKRTMLGEGTATTRAASQRRAPRGSGDGQAEPESSTQQGDAKSSSQQEATVVVTESVTPPENNPASGSPIIEGDPNPGETLSASLEDIADDDGISDSVFAFQWYRFDGTDNDAIANATSDILNIDEDDVGDAISVTVSFVDDLGNDEFLTSHSVVVETVEPLAGFIDDDTVPGEHDGYQSFTFELYFSEEPVLGFEAVRDHVLDVINGDVTSVRRTTQGSNIRWEITVQPDGNDEVTLLLPFTDNCDDEGAVCTASGKKLLVGAAVFVRGPATSQEQTAANTAATGTPAITGTARVGETLTADTSAIADADGLTSAEFNHQWLANDGTTDSDIPGETGATYVVQPGDAGKMIRVRVSFTDDEGNNETLTSAATAAVAATFPGTPRSLQVQTAGAGELAATWQPPESNGGSDVTGYRVQWKLATGNWDTEADVSSATTTDTSYTITSLSLDTEYAVRVIATNGAGDGPPSAEQTETARAQTSKQRDSTPNTAATGAPTISGAAQAGETLTADTSDIADENGLDNASFSYQWLRSDGTSDTSIIASTGATYTVHNDDAEQSLRVQVSFIDDDGFEESLTSEATAIPAPTPLTGAFDESTVPASHNGSTAFTLEFFFNKEPSLEEAAVRDQVLSVTGGQVTSASRTTQGSALRWEITVQPDGDDDVTVTLPRTTGCADPGAVCTQYGQMLSNKISTTISGPEPQQQQQEEDQGLTEPPPAPTGLTGTINDDGTITLGWTAPEDDSVTGYQVLRRRPQWRETDLEVYVDDTGSPAATYTDTNTVESTLYVYRVKARNAAGLSEWSNFVRIYKVNQG